MTTLRKINEFITAIWDWRQYIERINQFFIANDISEEMRQTAIFSSSCGAVIYSLSRNLLAPAKPSETLYNGIIRVIKEQHQNPKPSGIFESYKFNKRDRQLGESLPVYVSELKCLWGHG